MKKSDMFDNRTETQKENTRLLNHANRVRYVAQNNGDTSDLRREITPKEAQRIKDKRRQAKASRKGNR